MRVNQNKPGTRQLLLFVSNMELWSNLITFLGHRSVTFRYLLHDRRLAADNILILAMYMYSHSIPDSYQFIYTMLFFFAGESLQIGIEIIIASFDSISEVNMVSVILYIITTGKRLTLRGVCSILT